MSFLDPFAQIRIVLVKPSDPGNVGAVARAMKTMGLKRLYLVSPKTFPDCIASIRASNALDVLADAVVVNTLKEALSDCKLVLGTSTRPRELNWISLSARAAAEKVSEFPQHEIAIVFGSERCGLTNQELQQCHFQISIPANPHYNSLNLASAVQIVCYELHIAFSKERDVKMDKPRELADGKQLEYFYQHLYDVLIEIKFLHTSRSQQIMDRLRRLFSRAMLDETEVRILRGILSAVQKKLSVF